MNVVSQCQGEILLKMKTCTLCYFLFFLYFILLSLCNLCMPSGSPLFSEDPGNHSGL